MATSKSYLARPSYRFLPGDRATAMTSDSVFELDESDVWNNSARSSSPEFRQAVPTSRLVGKKLSKRSESKVTAATMASSLPVNVPDWSKILGDDYRENRWREGDGGNDYDGEECENGSGGEGGSWIPPHEFLARQMARTRIAASFSVHEGIGRTLKGRDLSRVRNAIWEKTGFQD